MRKAAAAVVVVAASLLLLIELPKLSQSNCDDDGVVTPPASGQLTAEKATLDLDAKSTSVLYTKPVVVPASSAADCSVFFAVVVVPPPPGSGTDHGGFWGKIGSLWTGVAQTAESIYLTQSGACVDLVVTDELVATIPSSITDDFRTSVTVSNVNREEYPCWIGELAAIQLQELNHRFGKNVVFFEADQYFLRDITHVFTKLKEFHVAYTMDHINGRVNSGVMFARQVSNTTLGWWRWYVDATMQLLKELNRCQSGANQMVLIKAIIDGKWRDWYAPDLINGTLVMKLPEMYYNSVFVGYGPDGPCDFAMYAASAVIHATGSSKFVTTGCGKQFKELLCKINNCPQQPAL